MGRYKLFDDKTYQEWTRTWAQPVVDAIYANDPQAGLSRIADARAALVSSELTPAQQECMQLSLDWYEFNLKQIGEHLQRQRLNFERMVEHLNNPGQTPQGICQRQRLMLALRCEGDANGFRTFTRKEVDEQLAAIPDSDKDNMVWQSLGLWAFRHRDKELLANAYELMLTQPSITLGQAKWQRVHLMHGLVLGTATRQDVLETVKSLAVLPQLDEFENLVWPRCIEAGLVDEELEQLLKEKSAAIKAQGPLPPPERRTKGIRSEL